MVKLTERPYACEICGKRYATENEAADCESLGKPEEPKYRIGMLIQVNHQTRQGTIKAKKIRRVGGAHVWRYKITNKDRKNFPWCWVGEEKMSTSHTFL